MAHRGVGGCPCSDTVHGRAGAPDRSRPGPSGPSRPRTATRVPILTRPSLTLLLAEPLAPPHFPTLGTAWVLRVGGSSASAVAGNAAHPPQARRSRCHGRQQHGVPCVTYGTTHEIVAVGVQTRTDRCAVPECSRRWECARGSKRKGLVADAVRRSSGQGPQRLRASALPRGLMMPSRVASSQVRGMTAGARGGRPAPRWPPRTMWTTSFSPFLIPGPGIPVGL
jgi:hypothetical protein